MRKRLILIVIIQILFFGFGDIYAMQKEKCSDEILGLKTCVRLKNQKIELNKEFEIELVFKNVSKQPVRIYFIKKEHFRSFQSYFYLSVDGEYNMLTNVSPPHGYVVTEKDFHLINPYEELVFEQTLSVDSSKIKTKSSKTNLEWFYENKISRWEGGVQTLDGPTKKLFEGQEIPYIWVGKIDSGIEIEISE
jgi:hypothetical protein